MGTTFPPVPCPLPMPGVPSSHFTLWREGHAVQEGSAPVSGDQAEHVGLGQAESRAAAVRAGSAQPPQRSPGQNRGWQDLQGTLLPAPPHRRPGARQEVCGGKEAGPALLTASVGPKPKYKGGTCPLAPVPTTDSPPLSTFSGRSTRMEALTPLFTLRVFSRFTHTVRCHQDLIPLCGQ